MKRLVCLLGLLCLLGSVLSKPAEKYTNKYDNIDLEEILNNERLYKKYFDCLLGIGKCTPDGKELKEHVPEALATDCAKCTDKQRAGTDKVLRHSLENKPDDFKKLEALYDPDHTFRKRYEVDLEKKGLKLPESI